MAKNYSGEKWPNEDLSSAEEGSRPRYGRRTAIFWIVIALVLIAVIWGMDKYGWLPGSDKFQAVFLNNGQVYFGHLTNSSGNYLNLRDIYYLQITQPIQPGEANNASNINLVKLGNELHGPTDAMRINAQAVLFIEDLKSDSKVVGAIRQLEKSR